MTNNSQKGFARPILIAIVALVVVVAGVSYFATRKQPQTTSTTQTPTGEKTLEDGTIVKPAGTVVKKDETIIKPDGTMVKPTSSATGGTTSGETMMKYSGSVLAGKSSPLLDFTKADYDVALKSGKLIVLYFYANWCPLCKIEFPNAEAAFNQLTTDKVVGFRVNYKDSDTDADETALAREFGVPYQHTKVLLKNGVQVGKYPDSWDTARYVSEINKALGQ